MSLPGFFIICMLHSIGCHHLWSFNGVLHQGSLGFRLTRLRVNYKVQHPMTNSWSKHLNRFLGCFCSPLVSCWRQRVPKLLCKRVCASSCSNGCLEGLFWRKAWRSCPSMAYASYWGYHVVSFLGFASCLFMAGEVWLKGWETKEKLGYFVKMVFCSGRKKWI